VDRKGSVREPRALATAGALPLGGATVAGGDAGAADSVTPSRRFSEAIAPGTTGVVGAGVGSTDGVATAGALGAGGGDVVTSRIGVSTGDSRSRGSGGAAGGGGSSGLVGRATGVWIGLATGLGGAGLSSSSNGRNVRSRGTQDRLGNVQTRTTWARTDSPTATTHGRRDPEANTRTLPRLTDRRDLSASRPGRGSERLWQKTYPHRHSAIKRHSPRPPAGARASGPSLRRSTRPAKFPGESRRSRLP
jgi:hypothetical protein